MVYAVPSATAASQRTVAAEFIFADTVTLHFSLRHFERTARAFAVNANISQITFIFQFDAHYPMPADLVFLQPVDKTGSIACDFIAQGFQQPVIQAVQLKANAAAVFHNGFGKHIIMLERSQPAAQNIQILIGHIFQMRVLQQLQRRQVRRRYDLRQMQFYADIDIIANGSSMRFAFHSHHSIRNYSLSFIVPQKYVFLQKILQRCALT